MGLVAGGCVRSVIAGGWLNRPETTGTPTPPFARERRYLLAGGPGVGGGSGRETAIDEWPSRSATALVCTPASSHATAAECSGAIAKFAPVMGPTE
jgi:hypothetical protein